MEVWSIYKMGFLPSLDYVHTTVWMPHEDTYKMHREKAGYELHRNATSYFEQILEATPQTTAAVWPHNYNYKNHSRKTKKIRGTLL